MTQISIIICTRNRAENLRTTLETLAWTKIPPGFQAEVIVVDNGSTDHTEKVVRHAPRTELEWRYLAEPRPGKSHAYNTALATARGDILLSTDDDVCVPLDWIEPMCQPILEGRAALVQGGVVPAPHLARPWLRNSFLAVSASVDPLQSAVPPSTVGANLAFSRAALEIVKGFDPLLGPGSLGGLCEDTLFGAMVRQAGMPACYAVGGGVEHHFDRNRLEPANVLEVAQRMGRSHALMDYHWNHIDAGGARLRAAFVQAKLGVRLFLTPRNQDPIPEWHFCYERELSYQKQLAALAGTKRRYQRRATAACLD